MAEAVAHRIELPSYTLGEEVANSITHGVGALAGVAALALMAVKASTPLACACVCLFGAAIITTYSVSCVYHALSPRVIGKRVMRVLDHCSVYILVFGTYIPAALLGVGGALGWALFGFVGLIAATGITFSAINLSRFSKIGVACHLVSGWSFLIGLPHLSASFGFECAALIVTGGVAYSLGAILYGLGRNHSYMHSVFHVFCLAGTLFQFLAIYLFLL